MTDTEELITKGSVSFQILQSEQLLEGQQPPVELLVRPDVRLRPGVLLRLDELHHQKPQDDQQQDQQQLDQMLPDQLLNLQPLHPWSLSMEAIIT